MAVIFAALWLALFVTGFIALLIVAVTSSRGFALSGSFRSAAGLVSVCGSSVAGSLVSGRFTGGRSSSGFMLPGCGLFGNSCVVAGAGGSGSYRSAVAASLFFGGSGAAGGFEGTDFGDALCKRNFKSFGRF